MVKNPLKGVNPNITAAVAGLILIAIASAVGAYTGAVNISSAAVATVGAVVAGLGVHGLMKGK